MSLTTPAEFTQQSAQAACVHPSDTTERCNFGTFPTQACMDLRSGSSSDTSRPHQKTASYTDIQTDSQPERPTVVTSMYTPLLKFTVYPKHLALLLLGVEVVVNAGDVRHDGVPFGLLQINHIANILYVQQQKK